MAHYIPPEIDLGECKWHLEAERVAHGVQVDPDTMVGQAIPAEQVGLDAESQRVLWKKVGPMVGMGQVVPRN